MNNHKICNFRKIACMSSDLQMVLAYNMFKNHDGLRLIPIFVQNSDYGQIDDRIW